MRKVVKYESNGKVYFQFEKGNKNSYRIYRLNRFGFAIKTYCLIDEKDLERKK